MKFPFFKKPRPPIAEIAAYRKHIKLYDIFTFLNELDLLEIRLNILYPYVDFFVIIESTQTFSGQPKRCVYLDNQKRFEKFQDKILHYIIDDTPSDENELQARLNDPNISTLDKEIISNALTSDNVPKGIIHWLKEFYQKESIKRALVKLNDNDVCFVSDVDEIWNPEVVVDYWKDDIFKLRQTVYAYYLNNRSSEQWHGTLVTKYKNIRLGCLNHLRTVTKTPYIYIENGGWHFTNQGGAEQIKHKVEATYSVDDYNNDNVKSKIQERMVKNKDYIGRKFKFNLDERGLPSYILENRAKYKSFFKLQNS